MGSDHYQDWADRYDLFPDDRSEEVAFFRRLFADNHVSKVLDCACGTGNELLTFSELGCEVVGSDVSESMLAHARRKVDDAGLDIPLHPARLPASAGRALRGVRRGCLLVGVDPACGR